ncbi:hypothetical protein AXG93_1609s1000 [Marchantia polymorpha subsp. ruderalis]|uniref:Integrase catalytic domain-containing protein n=1 Tax=Marchantia polymorpha subsp. ruderalis TaxID=1480154 RepID=A0A176W2R8_MARPO|nr:hypothetical protein AXG93_1609s1000 [Marchantia polymorpha subsp. ruderalis]
MKGIPAHYGEHRIDLMENVVPTFERCRESQLSLHPEKCFFFMTSGILLGHRVSASGIVVDVEKVKVILALEPPTNLQELRAFLGHVGHYRRFIYMYAISAAGLTKLLKKDEPYEWGKEQQEFTFTVQTRKGVHHENADYLSRMWTQPEEADLPDDFPDEQLFQLTPSVESSLAGYEAYASAIYSRSHRLRYEDGRSRGTRKDDAVTVAKFLFESIITRYGCLLELVSDRGTHFLNKVIEDLTLYFQIKHRKTTPYNPKANGLTEKPNGLLCKILLKVTTKQTPYFLIYGQHTILPIEFEVPTHRILDPLRLGAEASQLYRLQEVMALEERRQEVVDKTRSVQLKKNVITH